MIRRVLLVAVSVLACAVSISAARAEWPERPIRWIVPFGPGGANDLVARVAAEAVRKRLGQPIIIENRPGAGAVVGTAAVAKAAPDGYTFLIGATGVITNSMLLKNLS
jgi:tripartite-type tricarboxylate transporter receptor subunit TctC